MQIQNFLILLLTFLFCRIYWNQEVISLKYEIGAKIRYFRELRGLSQKGLASKIGVSNSRVSNWEQGINRPDADILAAICHALEVSADNLLDVKLSNDSLTESEQQLLTDYRSFNDEGKEKVRDYVADLADNPKYKKHSEPVLDKQA